MPKQAFIASPAVGAAQVVNKRARTDVLLDVLHDRLDVDLVSNNDLTGYQHCVLLKQCCCQVGLARTTLWTTFSGFSVALTSSFPAELRRLKSSWVCPWQFLGVLEQSHEVLLDVCIECECLRLPAPELLSNSSECGVSYLRCPALDTGATSRGHHSRRVSPLLIVATITPTLCTSSRSADLTCDRVSWPCSLLFPCAGFQADQVIGSSGLLCVARLRLSDSCSRRCILAGACQVKRHPTPCHASQCFWSIGRSQARSAHAPAASERSQLACRPFFHVRSTLTRSHTLLRSHVGYLRHVTTNRAEQKFETSACVKGKHVNFFEK